MKCTTEVMMLTAFLAILNVAGAQAGERSEAGIRIVVPYGDLDLNRPAGAKALIGRMEVAASRACGGLPDVRELTRIGIYETCMHDTMDRAMAQLDAPLVHALYEPLAAKHIAAGN